MSKGGRQCPLQSPETSGGEWTDSAEPAMLSAILELFPVGSDSYAAITVCPKHIMFCRTERTVILVISKNQPTWFEGSQIRPTEWSSSLRHS